MPCVCCCNAEGPGHISCSDAPVHSGLHSVRFSRGEERVVVEWSDNWRELRDTWKVS